MLFTFLHFSFSWPPCIHHIFHMEKLSTILDKIWMEMSEPVAGFASTWKKFGKTEGKSATLLTMTFTHQSNCYFFPLIFAYMRFRFIHTVRKVSIPEFLYCRMLWVPHPLSRAKWLHPSLFLLPVYSSPTLACERGGGGWPQIVLQHRKSDTL